LIALVIVVAGLILGQILFQWARHRGWTTYTEDDGLAGDYVSSIAVAPDGALWLGTVRGISRFDGEAWTNYTKDDGLAANGVRAIAVALDGALWFGTGTGGVSRFDGETWTSYTVDDGLRSNSVLAIAVAPDGALWFVTEFDGVSRFDGKTWTDYTKRDGLPGLCIAVAPDGTVWIGTKYYGVSRFDGQTWTTYTKRDGLADNYVQAITVAPDGALWFGTERGISRFDPLAKGKAWTTYTAADGLAGDDVRSVAMAADGRLWVSSEGRYWGSDGVSYFDGETWTRIDGSGLAEELVSALMIDLDGRVWMGTHGGGLVVFDERAVVPVQVLQAWAVLRPIAIAASVLLVLVWIMLRFHALPEQRRARAISGLRSRTAAGIIPGGLAILSGLMWWVLLLVSGEWTLFNDLLLEVLPVVGLLLSSTGLVLSFKATRGDTERQSVVGRVLNLLALVILAYPVLLLSSLALCRAFDISVQ